MYGHTTRSNSPWLTTVPAQSSHALAVHLSPIASLGPRAPDRTAARTTAAARVPEGRKARCGSAAWDRTSVCRAALPPTLPTCHTAARATRRSSATVFPSERHRRRRPAGPVRAVASGLTVTDEMAARCAAGLKGSEQLRCLVLAGVAKVLLTAPAQLWGFRTGFRRAWGGREARLALHLGGTAHDRHVRQLRVVRPQHEPDVCGHLSGAGRGGDGWSVTSAWSLREGVIGERGW